jgi:hypothetical protein
LNSSSSSPAQVLPHELGILAHVGGHHLADLPGVEQLAEPEAVHPAVVRGDGEVLHPAVHQRVDEVLGNAAEAEAPAAIVIPSKRSPSSASRAEP